MEDDNPHHLKMREAAERRRQNLRKAKDNKKSMPESKLKDYSNDTISEYQKGCRDVKLLSITANEIEYHSNHFYSEIHPDTYFMICQNDITESTERYGNSIFQNLEQFIRNSNGILVIRSFKPHVESERVCVFTDDIQQIIPLALLKMRTWNDPKRKKLNSYKNIWTTKPHMCKIIEISEFKRILKEFSIDESLITIIRDPIHDHTTQSTLHTPLAPVYTVNPNGEEVMTHRQALFYLFQSVICGINWHTEKCMENEQAITSFQAMYFFDVTEVNFLMEEESLLITKEFVEQQIARLKSHRIFTENIVEQTTDYFLSANDPKDSIDAAAHNMILNDLGCSSEVSVPMMVWATRYCSIFNSFENIYYSDITIRKYQLVEELCRKIPFEFRAIHRRAMRVHIRSVKLCEQMLQKNGKEDISLVYTIPPILHKGMKAVKESEPREYSDEICSIVSASKPPMFQMSTCPRTGRRMFKKIENSGLPDGVEDAIQKQLAETKKMIMKDLEASADNPIVNKPESSQNLSLCQIARAQQIIEAPPQPEIKPR